MTLRAIGVDSTNAPPTPLPICHDLGPICSNVSSAAFITDVLMDAAPRRPSLSVTVYASNIDSLPHFHIRFYTRIISVQLTSLEPVKASACYFHNSSANFLVNRGRLLKSRRRYKMQNRSGINSVLKIEQDVRETQHVSASE